MPVWPDIVVTKPDSPEILLAVEVKVTTANRTMAEEHIKDYMGRQSCPTGILITPEDTLFFRNPFTGYEGDTIQKVGECGTSDLLGAMPDRTTEPYLTMRVEEWLESLAAGGRRVWPPSAAEAIESLVIPAVVAGVIRATGPRWRRTGS